MRSGARQVAHSSTAPTGSCGSARIFMRVSGERFPYFRLPADSAGGRPGCYTLERRVAQPDDLPAHSFDEHMLLLPVGGEPVAFESTLNGRRVRGSIEPERFRFLAAGDVLATRWSAPMDSILVALQPATLHRMVNADAAIARTELISRIAAHDNCVLMHLILALYSHVGAGGVEGVLFSNSLMAAIASRIIFSYGNGARRESNPTRLPRWKLARIEQYIHDHLAGRLSLGDVASIVEMSPYHLCRTFREATGRSLWQYVLECRIERAIAMIGGRRELPLACVASACGFESYSQFIAAFKKFRGCLPSRYRRTIGR